ncbi:MAG: hypothetical protein V1910_01100 [bacterium]
MKDKNNKTTKILEKSIGRNEKWGQVRNGGNGEMGGNGRKWGQPPFFLGLPAFL